MLHVGGGRTALQDGQELFELDATAFGNNLDIAVIQIAHIAAQAKRACLAAREIAKADALHVAVYARRQPERAWPWSRLAHAQLPPST